MNSPKIIVVPDSEMPEVAIIRIEGDLDSASIEEISRSFESVTGGDYVFGVVDMSDVGLISSAVLGELMGYRSCMLDKGGDLVLAGLSPSVKEKLNTMDAHKIFKFCKDVKSAVNAFNWDYKGRAEKICLIFPSQLKYVPPVRQMISRLARQKGYSNRDSFRIETIVDEVCNNAVEHGLRQSGAEVTITTAIDREKIEIQVINTSDQTKAHALKELSKSLCVQKKSANERRGRGLKLIKMLSNDFKIEHSEGGTSVHVTKLKEE